MRRDSAGVHVGYPEPGIFGIQSDFRVGPPGNILKNGEKKLDLKQKKLHENRSVGSKVMIVEMTQKVQGVFSSDACAPGFMLDVWK